MADEITLPPRLAWGATLEQVTDHIHKLDDYIHQREPVGYGSPLDKFLTTREAVRVGLVNYSGGITTGGGGTGTIVLPPITGLDPTDPSAPDDASGLTVTPGVGYFFIEIDPPNYTQGGGNGRTIIYAANYSGSGPLPTFGSAVEVGSMPGSSSILVIDAEPGVTTHFWAKAETRHPTLQATPTGGTNGVSDTSAQIDGSTNAVKNLSILSAKIVSLSAAKITAGNIGVGEYIRSNSYSAGIAGWSIDGAGTAEFQNVITRGTVYATAGAFGGVTIDGALTMNTTGHIKGGQTAYNTGTGFFLGYSGAAYKFSIGDGTSALTWDGSTLTVKGTIGGLTFGSGAYIRQGQTAYDTGTGFWMGDVAGTPKLSIGSSTNALLFNGTNTILRGQVVLTENLATDSVSEIYDVATGSYASGNPVCSYTVTVPSGETWKLAITICTTVWVTESGSGSYSHYASITIRSDGVDVESADLGQQIGTISGTQNTYFYGSLTKAVTITGPDTVVIQSRYSGAGGGSTDQAKGNMTILATKQ